MQAPNTKSKNRSKNILFLIFVTSCFVLSFIIQFKPDLFDNTKPNYFFYKSQEQRAYYKTRDINIPEEGWTLYDLLNKNIRAATTDLSLPLVEFCLRHPIIAWQSKQLVKKINEDTLKTFPHQYLYNNNSDAYRHFVWAAISSKEFGLEDSKEILTKYEDYPDNPTREHKMDLFNNEQGFLYFQSLDKQEQTSKKDDADFYKKVSAEAQEKIKNKLLITDPLQLQAIE